MECRRHRRDLTGLSVTGMGDHPLGKGGSSWPRGVEAGAAFNPVSRKSCTPRSTEDSGKEDNIMQLHVSYNSVQNLHRGPLRLHRWSLSPLC